MGVSFASVGCGSDGSDDSSSSGDTCSADSLTVTVTGLPTGTAAKVIVSGGASSSITVDATKSLKLATGDYTIKASAATIADPIVRTAYSATVSTDTAQVTCGGTAATVTVTYALVPSSNKLWLGSQNSDSDTFGYASATLASGGDKVGDVTASTAGLPGAFDQAGNLWAIDDSAGSVGVKRYDAATLAGGGEETPDIILGGDVFSGGVPGPATLAFDPAGNLWVGITYSNEIAKFNAAQLTASSDTVTPDVEIKDVTAPAALAFDVKGNLWVGSGDDVLGFTADQLAASGSPTPATKIDAQAPAPVMNALTGVQGLAFDASGNLWVNFDGTIAELTSLVSGTVTPAVQFQADVLALPEGIAFDESGGLWMAYSAGKFCKFGASQLTGTSAVAPEVVISNATLGSLTSPVFFPAPAKLGLYSSLD